MAQHLVWTVVASYAGALDDDARAQAEAAGGVPFDDAGRCGVAITVVAPSADAARLKALAQLPPAGVTATRVTRPATRVKAQSGPRHLLP